MESGEPESRDEIEQVGTTPSGVREVFSALPALSRVGWFSLGALVATTATLLVLLPGLHARPSESPVPFELFPFGDNSGVCQEWVALGSLQTSHEDAVATVRRIIPVLPTDVRADNLRVVRAFVPGDRWTIAVDAQSGAGDEATAGQIAAKMNTIPGTGMHFSANFYSSRRLYDSAHVLCMPRQSGTHP